MPFKIDVRADGTPVPWTATPRGATPDPDPGYEPALYAGARGDDTRYLAWLADLLADDPRVTDLSRERAYRSLDADDPSPVLRVGVDRFRAVRGVARTVRQREQDAHAPGVLPLYDVDLDPQFRYCLDVGRDPTPGRALRTLELALPDPALADGDPTELTVDRGEGAEPAGDTPAAVRAAVEAALADVDPDVLLLSSGDVVPLLADHGVDLGRRPGYRRLAGESTYVSYGRVGHSPARYDVPGRVLVDRSNSFLLARSTLAGLLYLVEQTGEPLQEVARDSIGGVLTAREVRVAREDGVLAPWQKRQTERFKSLERLHAADRGGTTFQPAVGVHGDVHQLDFASLYPNIIRRYNVSPETVCCDCHDGADVPELGYSVCDEPGFLGDVLAPLIEDRREWKRRIRAGDAPEDGPAAAKADAVKWVLVACFGYQGYRHAKFGRIETHEAINAYARDVLLTAKERFERAGWRVLHGIVDSLWVTPDPARDQRPVAAVADEVSDAVDVGLEQEGRFDWLAFCPRTAASGGALMRYFGRWCDDDGGGYRLRGVAARQRSTPPFVAAAQRDLLGAFDRERTPAAVCDRLDRHLAALARGAVPAADLAVTERVSQRADDYEQATRARAALERAADLGVPRGPGQDVEYVVVDDDAAGPERVRLAFEEPATCDRAFYADRLVRACATLLSPLGWDAADVRRYRRDTRDATLDAFT